MVFNKLGRISNLNENNSELYRESRIRGQTLSLNSNHAKFDSRIWPEVGQKIEFGQIWPLTLCKRPF